MQIILGERVEKTAQRDYGWENNISTKSLELDKPIIICLPGSGSIFSKQANGMCKCIEKML